MATTADFKNGLYIDFNGKPCSIVWFQHVKPGKGPAFVKTKLRNLENGRILEKTFNAGEKIDVITVEHREYQFLYADEDGFNFMNTETYDQIPIAKGLITGVDFMKESDIVDVVSDADTNTILYAEMPVKTVLRITHSEPGIKGDTATNSTKPATLETGVEIRVPLFIEEGELVQVDTRDGSYLQRVKE